MTESPENLHEPVDEISLIDILSVLWRNKLTIILLTGICACVVGVVAGPKALFSQKSITKLKFQIDFAGAEKGEYPNGMRFSTADITSPIILEKVFKTNNISQYMDLTEFRDSIAIQKSTDGLSFLEEKYSGLLGDKKLSAEERQALQDEYRTQKDKLLNHTQFYLVLSDGEMTIPADIQAKILENILNEWAVFTETKRGVYLYQIPMLTPDVFDFNHADEEYIVQVDMLRLMGERVTKNIESITELPGALLARSENGMSLPALQVKMSDLIRYSITPLSGLVRRGHLYNNDRLASVYLKEQIYELELSEKSEKGSMNLLKDSLDGYIASDDKLSVASAAGNRTAGGGTLIPQIGDGFLDRLVAMANENQDVKYRQNVTQKIVEQGQALLKTQKEITYYKDLLPETELRSGQLTESVRKDLLDIFKQKFSFAQKEAKRLTTEMNSLYQLISANNLRPEQTFYSSTTLPEYKKLYTQSVKKVAIVCIGVIFLFFAMVCFILLLRDNMKKTA